jgi:hypothetical protein
VRRQDDDAIEFDVQSQYDHKIIRLQPKMPDFCLMPQGAPTARPAPIADRIAKPISAITWPPTP